MKFVKIAILAIILSISPTVFAKFNFSDTQIANMQKAYQFGQSQGKKNYHGTNLSVGYIMAAILWQESSAGINIKNGHAVGAFQNYIPTVKSRLKQQGVTKSHSEISRELSNINRSAHWANVEIDSWLKTHKGNMPKALASYNAGYNVGAGYRYSSSIIRKATYLRDQNILKVK